MDRLFGEDRRHHVLAALTGVTAVAMVSKVVGLGREAGIAGAFGTSGTYDLFLLGVMFPTLLWGVLAVATHHVFVPALTPMLLAADGPHWRPVWRLYRRLTTATALSAIALAIAAPWLLMPWTLPLTAGETEVAVHICRVASILLVLCPSEAFLRAVLNVRREYIYPAWGTVIFSLVALGLVLSLASDWSVLVIAWAFVAGFIAQNGFLIWRLRKIGAWSGSGATDQSGSVSAFGAALLIVIVIEVFNRSFFLFDRYVGPGLGSGVIAAMSYAQVLVQLPDAVLGVSLASVLFPVFASVRLDTEPERSAILYRSALAVGVTAALPLAALLVITAPDIVRIVYARGAFSDDSVALTATMLRPYAPSVLALFVLSTTVRAFYAWGWRRTVLWATLVAVLVKGGLTLVLPQYLEAAGLPTATTAAYVILAGWLTLAGLRRTPVTDNPLSGSVIIHLVIAAITASGVAALVQWFLASYFGEANFWRAMFRFSATGSVLLVVYTLLLIRFGCFGRLRDALKESSDSPRVLINSTEV